MAVMTLTGPIASFATGTYSVSRVGFDTYDTTGRLVQEDPTVLEFTGCVQPVRGKELTRLPEGLQSAEVTAVWSPVELLNRDRFEYAGSTWEVQRVEGWATLGAYFKVYAVKVEQQ